jgi:hypothetical protein
MSDAPVVSIDPVTFAADPYPALAAMRADTPICFVPQLGSTLITRRDDIYVCEKRVDVFSSDQPQGLMTRLMGQNMMRKDGEPHQRERAAIFPAVSPKVVREHWRSRFQAHADRLLDGLAPRGAADLVADFAMPFSGACLMDITGLIRATPQDMDAWSQGMIDGIANYGGNPEIEARCHRSTAAIDAAVNERLAVPPEPGEASLIAVMRAAGLPTDAIRANVKLAISGGQNEPRDAIAGAAFALMTHPDERQRAMSGAVPWLQVFEEYARWMAPIGMSPRRVAKRHTYNGVTFEPEDRVFLMFGSANRDTAHFDRPDVFDLARDAAKSIAFGAGPHYCAGAFAARAMIADVALPGLFGRLRNLRPKAGADIRFNGWAFRGLVSLPVVWDLI